MIKKLVSNLLLLMVAIGGLAFFTSMPILFIFDNRHSHINWDGFFQIIIERLNPASYVIDWRLVSTWVDSGLFERYEYSLSIYGLSAILVCVLGLVISFVTVLSPTKIKNKLKFFINILEGIPDLLLIFLFQLFVIIICRTYDIKLFYLYGVNGIKPILFPVIMISLMPAVYLAQFFIKVIEEEKEQNYIILGESKGLSKIYVYLIHLLRNILPVMFIQYRTVIWMILSNLVLIEYMFNIRGYSNDLINNLTANNQSYISSLVMLCLFILPILLFDLATKLFSRIFERKEGVNI